MFEQHAVSAGEREFWQWIARAAFANPFSPERRELDLKITGSADPAEPLLTHAVAGRTKKLEAEGRADFRRYRGDDREIMRLGFLFEAYHRFLSETDELIREQIKAGDAPRPVPFAGEALALLARRGFDRSEAVRFLGIFYQLRRAYFFIVRGLVGASASMLELRSRLWNNVFTCDMRRYERRLWDRMEDFSTLLLGETGTGKGAAAAAVGRSGFIPFDEKKGCFAESFARNFISLNLSQFPETLIESELFGHRKGAFTGAVEAHQGVFARCSPHGAIFLDEIGEVSAPVQIKLLQVLQDRTFSPVGGHEKLRFHGRVIAATNRPLERLRSDKLFRDDFFYRLCSDLIVLPPLRRRLAEDPGEMNLLLDHILRRLTGEAAPDLVSGVRQTLMADAGAHYSWPGNVRELEQAVRRILLTGHYEGEKTPPDDWGKRLADGVENGTLDADGVLSLYCRQLYERHGTFGEVARRANLDPRTVKKYLGASGGGTDAS